MTVNRPVSTHEWLKHQLKVSGISQSQISRQLNLARNTVSLWLTARQKIPLKHLLSIARLLGTDQLYIRNIALQEMCPDKDLWELDEKIRLLGTLTANEYRFIKLIREVGTNPRMNEEQESRFTAFLKGLEPDDGTWELANLDSNNGRLYTSDEIKKILEEKLQEQAARLARQNNAE